MLHDDDGCAGGIMTHGDPQVQISLKATGDPLQ